MVLEGKFKQSLLCHLGQKLKCEIFLHEVFPDVIVSFLLIAVPPVILVIILECCFQFPVSGSLGVQVIVHMSI